MDNTPNWPPPTPEWTSIHVTPTWLGNRETAESGTHAGGVVVEDDGGPGEAPSRQWTPQCQARWAGTWPDRSTVWLDSPPRPYPGLPGPSSKPFHQPDPTATVPCTGNQNRVGPAFWNCPLSHWSSQEDLAEPSWRCQPVCLHCRREAPLSQAREEPQSRPCRRRVMAGVPGSSQADPECTAGHRRPLLRKSTFNG